MLARPLVRLVRRWGFTRYGSTPLHYSLHPSIVPTAAYQYGCLALWRPPYCHCIMDRVEDRPLYCGIRVNIRSTELIRPKIRSTFRDIYSTWHYVYWKKIYDKIVEITTIIKCSMIYYTSYAQYLTLLRRNCTNICCTNLFTDLKSGTVINWKKMISCLKMFISVY